MTLQMETASLAGLTGPVVSKGVAPQDYQNRTDLATSFDYAAAKLTARFRLRIETARLVCTLSGLGGAS
ncbi:MAG: hypothetical protein E5X67_30535 [Mesorhizobium sp.]|uniref:hypothetical protein n=1 Tax=Mesorhizobium sp. TaxID=1871066 RepID=UPI000FE91A6B|nr:hypothetical protein [Mesorhizobium sp.]RWO78004.1 MAG: hypothetical protein EOS18_20295 [Mesorhizobium sp.]TIP24117.1 MAG: hypothetical protein E5X67_30535 [Mesorhizobium sp.]